jgi:hypothetical protein
LTFILFFLCRGSPNNLPKATASVLAGFGTWFWFYGSFACLSLCPTRCGLTQIVGLRCVSV